MIFRVLFLLVGVFCCSTAVLMIKASHEHPVLLSAYRLLVAAVVLTPLFVRDYRRSGRRLSLGHFVPAFLSGLVLAAHFITWIIGARMTPSANASLIVNLVPIVMPVFIFVLIRERLTRYEYAGTVLAVGGMLLLTVSDFNINPAHAWGDLFCFLSMMLFGFYLALGRRNRHFATIWLYIVPLYYMAGIFCFLLSLFFINPVKPYPTREIVLIVGLGIVPTVLGHSILNLSMKYLRGQVVSIINMTQFVFAGALAYWLFGEIPSGTLFLAGVILLASGWLVLRKQDEGSEVKQAVEQDTVEPAS